MTQAYAEAYLNDAMKNLGEAFGYAVNACALTADGFMELFIASGYAEQFGKGNLYSTHHEAAEDKFVDTVNAIIKRKNNPTKLQAQRKRCGYSQRELAEKSGVNIRTLQQYELGYMLWTSPFIAEESCRAADKEFPFPLSDRLCAGHREYAPARHIWT